MASTQRASEPNRAPNAFAEAWSAERDSKVPRGVPVDPEVEQTKAMSDVSIGKLGSSARIMALMVSACSVLGIGAIAGPVPESARVSGRVIVVSPLDPGGISTDSSVE